MPCSGVTQHHKTDMGPITLPSSRNKVGNDAARGWHPTTQQKFPANKNSTSKVVSLPWHQVFIRMKRKSRSFMVFVWIECASLSPISSNILQVIFITNVRAMPGQTQAPLTPKSRTTTLQSICGCFRHIMWQRGISWRLIKWLPCRVLFGGCVAAALADTRTDAQKRKKVFV